MPKTEAALGVGAPKAPSLGVYVHFPYCLSKCGYCDFLSVPSAPEVIPHEAYADAVLAELERRRPAMEQLPVHSIFFGGGTPSLWEPSQLGRVLAALRGTCSEVEGGAEITVECNPSSFDLEKAGELRRLGVNRISLGVQSLNRERLGFLGRRHDEHAGLEAVRIARAAGFDNVSADFIFGVAGQSPDEAEREALLIAESGVRHLSAYALTIEPGTQFGELARSGRLPLLPDEHVAEAFERVHSVLKARGFVHYEISNYARPGAEARHNLGYWRGEPYVGLGVGAWGTLLEARGKTRYRNTPSLERYLSSRELGREVPLDREGPFVAVLEAITPEVDLSERVMLGLRLAEGLDLTELELSTGATFHTPERTRALRKWLERGALTLEGARLRLLKSQWLLADAVLRELL